MKEFVVTIDGPAASGKGTIAEKLAKSLNCVFLSTGNIYRCFALKLQQKHALEVQNFDKIFSEIAFKQLENVASEINLSDLTNGDLQKAEIGELASKLASIDIVRKTLLKFQQETVQRNSRIVLEGRDCGTVICPNANFKFFLTASLEVRAKRRYEQLKGGDESLSENEIFKQLEKRDERDSSRVNAPLAKAKDAHEIDSSHMNQAEVLEKMLSIIKA